MWKLNLSHHIFLWARFYKGNHNGMFNGYKPDWTPLEIEIELYDIGTKVKTSAGRKGVIEFTDGTRDYYTNIEVIDIA